MSNDKQPEIRFPEFTDEWEQVKLKDVATVFDGTHQTPKYTESGVKFVSVENIKTLETEKYISQEAYDSEYSKKQAKKGDVLMTRIGDIGTAKVIETDEPLAYYVTLALLKPNEIDSSFLAWLISSPEVQRNIWKRTLHIAFPKKINLGEINQIEINVPSLEEQTKIGTFFQNLDQLITLHQRKLDLLKETKKGFLQKMFPKNGAKVPEIRFPGFTEDWEERKLGDMMDVTSVKRIHQSDWTNSGIRFLRARDIVSAAKNEEPSDYLYISEEKYNEYSKISGKVSQGDLLVTGVGSIGVPLLITDDNPIYFKDGNIIWFKNEHKIDGNFFYYSFINNKIQKYIRDVAGIGTVGTYTIDSGKKTPISLPTYDEQIKIGSFFKQFDHTIMLHQHELDLLKETKKGFLQKMFV
ncbi:restriction endonuclease subunit S [Enterococcus faecium]|uniref:restriction endonuclease subunit S n=1 Tax=Enterococcus TaxID=1350 RepID=UPI00064CCB44|nr:restriction endonuclease subunit S [Enterococcus faecium]EHK4845614.1 restriction endonuclease subunit S [Enterococcus faecium]EME5973617.1 restriction endonuclease subunit S [Enterococcus faecium]MBJ7247445.1 restriction endonuclease subunit S [Enterococcus faecium]MDV4535632.1 restriction endonuclease subunit S [Enterococcus faecium]